MLECNEHKQEGIDSRHLGDRIDRTYWQSRWSVLVCCCCHNKLPEIWQLTQHPFIISQFWSQKSRGLSWVQGAQLGSLLPVSQRLKSSCWQGWRLWERIVSRLIRVVHWIQFHMVVGLRSLFFLAGCHLGVSLRPSLPLVSPHCLLHLRSSNSTLYSQAASSLWLTLLPSSSTFKVACDYICFTFSLF